MEHFPTITQVLLRDDISEMSVTLAYANCAQTRDEVRAPGESTTQNRSSTTGPTGPVQRIGPKLVMRQDLAILAKNGGHTIYWVGPVAGTRYEFTRTTTDRAYVWYLTVGAAVGNNKPDFLVVATYPFPKSVRGLKKIGTGREIEIPGGGIALVDSSYPQSVHFAFPGVSYQGEVFDPSPERSLDVATSGDIEPLP